MGKLFEEFSCKYKERNGEPWKGMISPGVFKDDGCSQEKDT